MFLLLQHKALLLFPKLLKMFPLSSLYRGLLIKVIPVFHKSAISVDAGRKHQLVGLLATRQI